MIKRTQTSAFFFVTAIDFIHKTRSMLDLTAYCCKTRNAKDFGAFRVLQQAAVACNSSFIVLRYKIIGKTADQLHTITQIVCQYCLRTCYSNYTKQYNLKQDLNKGFPRGGEAFCGNKKHSTIKD